MWNLAQRLKLFANIGEFRASAPHVYFPAGKCFYIRFDLCALVYNWNLDEEQKLYGRGRIYGDGARYLNCQLHGWDLGFICHHQNKKTIVLNQIDLRGIPSIRTTIFGRT